MRTRTKAALTVLCALLLVVATFLGTLAYLTSADKVTNTFTVGKVKITLDETDVDLNGVQDGDTRVQTNQFHLMPGKTYKKDPIVHVEAGSEDSYVFVKVDNGLAAIEGNETIAAQIIANGWTQLNDGEDDVAGVYYKIYLNDADDSDLNLNVFETLNVSATATNDALTAVSDKTIDITAYAIQKDTSFADAYAAWDAAGFATLVVD